MLFQRPLRRVMKTFGSSISRRRLSARIIAVYCRPLSHTILSLARNQTIRLVGIVVTAKRGLKNFARVFGLSTSRQRTAKTRSFHLSFPQSETESQSDCAVRGYDILHISKKKATSMIPQIVKGKLRCMSRSCHAFVARHGATRRAALGYDESGNNSSKTPRARAIYYKHPCTLAPH